MSACRSCGADITWCVTDANGRMMPVDTEPHPDGNVELAGVDQYGTPIAVVHPQPDLLGGPRHMPHHATCPQRDQWRAS